MKSILLTYLCCIGICSFGQVKHSNKDSTRYYDHSQISIGFQQQVFDQLNTRLIQYFPRSIPEKHFTIGYGGKSVFNHFIFQGDIGIGAGFNGERGKGSTRSFLAGLNLDGGVMLTRPGSIRIYPFAGLGIDFASVTAKIRTDNIPFDTVLSSPFARAATKPVSMSNFFFSWRSGLAIDFGNPKKGNHPYSFGLRAGYKRSFNNGRWRLAEGNNFTNPPYDQLEQWFASIVFYSPIRKGMKKLSTE